MSLTENEIAVSIICTAYNHEKYIRQCLQGFVMQKTTFPFEVLINDDASTDGTAKIIREYERKFPEIIKPFYQKTNLYSQGLSAMKLYLLPNTKGKYIAFCEGDDFWTSPDKLQLQYEAMEAHPECSVCAHYVDFVSENGTSFEDYHPKRTLDAAEITSREQVRMALYDNVQTSSVFIRSELQKEYLEDFPEYSRISSEVGIGDIPKYLYCATKGCMYFIPQLMSCYRIASIGSWTCRVAQGDMKTREKLWRHQSDMLESFNGITEGKYADICYPRMVEWRFRSLGYGARYREMMDSVYKNLRKKMTAKERVVVFCGAYFPWLLNGYRRLTNRDY